MRRRELLAGVGSVGVIGAAGAVALGGLPGRGDEAADPRSDGSSIPGPVSIETLDAPGSEAGSMVVPGTRPTFVEFFGTWCGPCEQQMPALAAANERVGDEVVFVSVTAEGVPDAEIVEWWEANGGNWLLGRDRSAELAAKYNQPGLPYSVAIGASGSVGWSEPGLKTADEIVSGIQTALGDG